MSGPRLCKVPIPNYVEGNLDIPAPCGVETTDPKSPYCYWHRIDRTRMDDQIKNALARQESPEFKPKAEDIPPGWRWCSSCEHIVPLWYVPNKETRCKGCMAKLRRERRDASLYGLSTEDRVRLTKTQSGKCAICRKRQNVRGLAVDHNHRTKAVRGLLCLNCNHYLLGSAADDPAVLWAALCYMINPPNEGRWVEPSKTLPLLKAVAEKLRQIGEVQNR